MLNMNNFASSIVILSIVRLKDKTHLHTHYNKINQDVQLIL